MLRLVKYNGGSRHFLEEIGNKQDAIKQAKTLHHPDWPDWQGIMVLEQSANGEYYTSIFDSNG